MFRLPCHVTFAMEACISQQNSFRICSGIDSSG